MVKPRGRSFTGSVNFVTNPTEMSLWSFLRTAGTAGLVVLIGWYLYYATRKTSADKDDAVVLGIGLFMLSIFLGTITVNWAVFRNLRPNE